MPLRLERIVDIDPLAVGTEKPFLHELAVRGDVQFPFPELIDLPLFFTDDHGHLCLTHPGELALSIDQILIIGGVLQRLFEFINTRVPVLLDQFIHANRRGLVDRDEHCLARLPFGRKVLDEVLGDQVEALGRGDDMRTRPMIRRAMLKTCVPSTSRRMWRRTMARPKSASGGEARSMPARQGTRAMACRRSAAKWSNASLAGASSMARCARLSIAGLLVSPEDSC